jgi:hypothetical protein
MKRIYFWLVGIITWFLFFYNIERLSHPINISSFVYVYTAMIAVLMLALPPLYKVSLFWPFLAALLPYFYLKQLMRYEIMGIHLPLTITEIVAIGMTILLTGQLLRQLKEARDLVTNLTVSQLNKGTAPFETGQGQLYREIRRARINQRPAALVTIGVTDQSYQMSLNRFIEEAQMEIIRHYVSARMANLLITNLRDFDVITQRGSHFVALLPETSREEALKITDQLAQAALSSLGLHLKFGLSTFPDQAVTFERLLEAAETEMKAGTPASGDTVLTVS